VLCLAVVSVVLHSAQRQNESSFGVPLAVGRTTKKNHENSKKQGCYEKPSTGSAAWLIIKKFIKSSLSRILSKKCSENQFETLVYASQHDLSNIDVCKGE